MGHNGPYIQEHKLPSDVEYGARENAMGKKN